MNKEKLKEILISASENKYSADDIHDDTDIIEDLGFDSIMYLKVIIAIEDETGVELDDEDIESISVFASLLRTINEAYECKT